MSGNSDNESVKEIIDYLNSAIGTRYTTRSKSTNAKIKARIKEGHTIDDFKTVIDNKSAQWKDNAKMRTYLRPETLFAAEHFESYLNEGNINGSGNKVISRTDEEQRNAEIDRYLESDEYRNGEDGCKYCSRRTGTCDYRLITGLSRVITNNMRIDPAFCDKYVRGDKEYDGHEWQRGAYTYGIYSRSVLRG